jgi:hypothetical protein
MNMDLVPALDPAGVPGPEWLFHVLLVLTFFLHLLFLNLTLGGTLLAAVSHLAAGGRRQDPRAVLAGRLMGVNSYGISLTITTGVAPLLFVQVLYQQYFYTATILIGWVWFAFLGLLMVGYYAAYAYKFRSPESPPAGGSLWLLVSATMFLLIAMVHVAVHLIHAQPGGWDGFAANPWQVVGDPTYLPRLLHFVLAGVGMSSLVSCWWALRQAKGGRDEELNNAIARHTWKWALWATVLQVVDGVVLLVLLPRPVLAGMMQGGAVMVAPLAVAVVAGLGLLVMLARVSEPAARPTTVTGTLAAMILVVAVMAVTRHQVRLLYLQSVTGQFELQTSPQWFNIAVFVVLLVAGLITVYLMTRRVLTSPAEGEEAA